jgi:hypothetical protein
MFHAWRLLVGSRRYYDCTTSVVVVRTGGDHIHAGASPFVLEVITSTGGDHIHDGVSLFVVEVITPGRGVYGTRECRRGLFRVT